MKLYHFLILSLFAFVSCDSNKNPFVEKNVYLLERKEKYEGTFDTRGKFGVHLDISFKFTISKEDNCTYYIYKFEKPVELRDSKFKGNEYLLSNILPPFFKLEFFDKETNKIFTMYNLPEIDPNEFGQKGEFLSAKTMDETWIARGKVWEGRHHWNETYKMKSLVDPKYFRSKIERMSSFKLYFYYGKYGSYRWK